MRRGKEKSEDAKLRGATETGETIYCTRRQCRRVECLRHDVNTPRNKLIMVNYFTADNDEDCQYYLGE